jgi:hypothetical protein
MSESSAQAQTELEEARKVVVECEKEIQDIKKRIRELGEEDGDPNSIEVVVLKVRSDPAAFLGETSCRHYRPNLISNLFYFQVEGLPDGAQPSFSLQLSSPIEEQNIIKLHDPNDPPAEGSVAIFQGVETSTATLTVSAKDADIELGSSSPMDVSTLFHGTDQQPPHIATTDVSILNQEETICSATLRITYTPSAKDQREELYDSLEKVVATKNRSIGDLNAAARAVTRAKQSQIAVKPGFLNNQSKAGAAAKKERMGIVEMFYKYLGPQSWVHQYWNDRKNYIIFFGAVLLMHFKGQELALPPPV